MELKINIQPIIKPKDQLYALLYNSLYIIMQPFFILFFIAKISKKYYIYKVINIPKQTKPNCKITINAKINKIKKELIKEIIYLTLEKEKINNKNLIIEIINTREDQIKELNQKYLNKDESTDIISIKNEENKETIKNEACILGTIFICSKIIKQKSIDLNKDELQHLIHLIIHGTLHLLGYNHEEKEERIIMQQKEVNILSKLGITSPY